MKIRTFLTVILTWMVAAASAQGKYDILTFGAKGDGVTDDAVAIQKAIDRCSAEGGGVVLVPRNHVFLSGPVELKSHVELHLEATATLKANPDEMHRPIGTLPDGHVADGEIGDIRQRQHMRTGIEGLVCQGFQFIRIRQLGPHEGDAVAMDRALASDTDVFGILGPEPEHTLAPVLTEGTLAADLKASLIIFTPLLP